MSRPQSPPTACAAHTRLPTRGNAGAGRRYRSGRLAARGGRADLMRRQGTKAFSFPAASHPTPHRTTPWAPQPQAQPPQRPPGWVSSQTKPDSGLGGLWGGRHAGSAMEMNFDPNCKAPTPYLLFKANPFHRVNITPLFNPAPPAHIPGPDLRPLLIAALHPSSLQLIPHPQSPPLGEQSPAQPGRSDYRCHPTPTAASN